MRLMRGEAREAFPSAIPTETGEASTKKGLEPPIQACRRPAFENSRFWGLWAILFGRSRGVVEISGYLSKILRELTNLRQTSPRSELNV